MRFNTYTGNAMLNAALMTVEALAGLKSVSEITPSLLLELKQRYDVKGLNTRLKSYTMLFSRNGPLHNDANGLKIYDSLMNELLSNVEVDGENICEVSGFTFSTTFEKKLTNVLRGLGYKDTEIRKKDVTLNRNWFPLIGGLGSDAQALPQAKFAIKIHPYCIGLMQFLPLSALLYKGGVLLVDSSNYEFSRQFVKKNVREIEKRIQMTPVEEDIENVRDYSKGNYLLQALRILEDKLDDEYSDLNLWSFSNSGTGAQCDIDRVPNSLLRKLITLRNSPSTRTELERILSDRNLSDSFLESLENNTDWFGLYPAVWKKKIKYEGVSVDFLERFFTVTHNNYKIAYARYLAYLINKYKAPSFLKYLSKTDAWDQREYKFDVFALMVTAVRNNEWDLEHHCEIIDNPNNLPVKNTFFGLHRLIHFYFQKHAFDSTIPELQNGSSVTIQVCKWLISLIDRDEKRDYFVSNLRHSQNYATVSYLELFLRNVNGASVSLETIMTVFFDGNFRVSWSSINELLRLHYNQHFNVQFDNIRIDLPIILENDVEFLQWKNRLLEFAHDYQNYYLFKYSNRTTGTKPFNKLLKQISEIPTDARGFVQWLAEATENVNDFLLNSGIVLNIKWDHQELLFDPRGNVSVTTSLFAIKFLMLKHYHLFTVVKS